jgi:hypothetical protein
MRGPEPEALTLNDAGRNELEVLVYAKLSLSFASEPERKALSFLTCSDGCLRDHCLHLLSLCTAFSLLTMAPTYLFFPLLLVFGASRCKAYQRAS